MQMNPKINCYALLACFCVCVCVTRKSNQKCPIWMLAGKKETISPCDLIYRRLKAIHENDKIFFDESWHSVFYRVN